MRITIHVDIPIETQKLFREWKDLFGIAVKPKETRALIVADFERIIKARIQDWQDEVTQEAQEQEEGAEMSDRENFPLGKVEENGESNQ